MTALYRDVAAHAAARLGLSTKIGHGDSTSFHLHGSYNSEEEAPETGVIHIRQGYSRDYRPDLNQVILAMIVEHRAGLPLLMQPLSGNASDQAELPRLIDEHVDQLHMAHGVDYIVTDCAAYNATHLKRTDDGEVKFISRVPETINEAKEVIAQVEFKAMQQLSKPDGSIIEGYRYLEYSSHYGEVEQRWVMFFSEAAQERARGSVEKQLQRWRKQEEKAYHHLQERLFSCREDAQQALSEFASGLKASTADQVEVLECIPYNWPAGRIEPGRARYCIRGKLCESESLRAELVFRKSVFIVATNELDTQALPAEQLLSAYKGQARVERGFRFLKDPLFLASSLFLKNEKRIMALMMVMTVCLLVYAALEWRIRKGLREQDQSFPDQKGKPTQRPTARWVFQCFVGIHVLMLPRRQLMLNLNERHRVILDVLGRRYQLLYSSRPIEDPIAETGRI